MNELSMPLVISGPAKDGSLTCWSSLSSGPGADSVPGCPQGFHAPWSPNKDIDTPHGSSDLPADLQKSCKTGQPCSEDACMPAPNLGSVSVMLIIFFNVSGGPWGNEGLFSL